MRKFGFIAIMSIVGILFVLAAATGCNSGVDATVVPTASATVTITSGAGINSTQPVMPLAEPNIQLNTDHGTGGTKITVAGENFPAGSNVEIRLGAIDSEATRPMYAQATADSNGVIKATFTMPSYWPNGDPILQSQVLIVASTPDFVTKATAVFTNETKIVLATPSTK